MVEGKKSMPTASNPTNEEAADALITRSTAARAGLVAGGVASPSPGGGTQDTGASSGGPTAVVAEDENPEAADGEGAN